MKRVIIYFIGGLLGSFGVLAFVDVDFAEGYGFLRELVLVTVAFAFGIGARDVIIHRPLLVLLVPIGILLLAFFGL